MTYQVVLSGCSGGGKSTLLDELGRRGFSAVPEPGRRIVAEELRGEGRALPWIDLAAFARRAMDLARQDRVSVSGARGWVFFDRGLIDAAEALRHATGQPLASSLEHDARFHRQVFMVPPWPEIFRTDDERQLPLSEAMDEYERLLAAYRTLDYEVILLPKADVRERADLVLSLLR